MKIGELFLDLFVKADTVKLKDFIHDLGDLKMSSLLNTLGLGELYNALNHIMHAADDTATNVNLYSKETGLSINKTQQFARYAEQMGANADDASASLKNLWQNIYKVKIGEGNVRPFALTGISPYEDFWTILDKIHKIMIDPKMDDNMKLMIANEFGLSDAMMVALKQSDAVWESQKKILVPQQEQINQMLEYHKNLKQIGQDWSNIGMDIAAFSAPLVDGFMKINDWLAKMLHTSQTFREGLAAMAVGFAIFLFPLFGAQIIFLALVAATATIAHYWQDISRWISDAAGKVKEFWGNTAGKLDFHGFMDDMRNFIHPNPAMQTAGAGSVSKSQQNEYNFHITGSDPQEIGREVMRHLEKATSDADGQAALGSR